MSEFNPFTASNEEIEKMSNPVPQSVQKPVKYHLPTLPEGYKKKYWIDSFGNTICIIYQKDHRENVVSFGVAWLNEADKDVADRAKGKAISFGRAWKNWKNKPSDKKPVLPFGTTYTFTLNGVPMNGSINSLTATIK